MTRGVIEPSVVREVAVGIVRTLREAGHEAYFAGGCVRDELLGRLPTDYDVATDATPERIGTLFRRTSHVGAAFGVVLVKHWFERYGRDVVVEVATFRADGPYSDKRRPAHVTFSDATTDAHRRDFTINALFLDPLSDEPDSGVGGKVIDYVGGREDLDRGVVRAVGDAAQRLAEDHLRALRAARFAAWFGFAVDEATARAIREHARDLQGVSKERIGDEVRKMVYHEGGARWGGDGGGVVLMEGLELDGPVLGEAAQVTDRAVVDAWASGREEARGRGERMGEAWLLGEALAAWAIDRHGSRAVEVVGGGEEAGSWSVSLCLSKEEAGALGGVLGGVMFLRGQGAEGWGGTGVAGRKRAAQKRWFAHAVAVLAAWDTGRGEEIRESIRILEGIAGGVQQSPWVTGESLVRLGVPTGAHYGRVLDEVYDAQLEGRVTDREMALEHAKRLCVQLGVWPS